METSIFRKIHRDILLEWKYSDSNRISEPFKILNNSKDNIRSYISGGLTFNTTNNQLFPVDIVKNKWDRINTSVYNFLSISDYLSTGPVQHDIVRLYFPVNFNFREYIGIFLRIYTYDSTNSKFVNLSNFFYDKNDTSQSSIFGQVNQPFLYEDRLWDRVIELQIPSVKFVSLQRDLGLPIPGTINDALTNGVGLSLSSPIFIDFSFLLGYEQIGSQLRYVLNNPFTVQVEQAPELEELQLYVQESSIGDYFEFYPIYNNSFDDFVTFIDQSKFINKDYYTEYLITIFEQNIKGKTTRFLIDDDFSEIIEWRPIIKYSSTVATIDVELKLVDKVDGSIIIKKASYGMKPDQISKYSLNIKKIKVKDIEKPKIYVKNITELSNIDSLTKGDPQEVIINIDSPVLIDLSNITAFSSNDINPKSESTLQNYHPLGSMKILIEPFDNIISFSIAIKNIDKLDFLDMTNCQNIRLSFRSDKSNYEYPIISNSSNLKNGSCSFRVPQKAYQDIKKLYIDKENLFYITTTNNGVRSVIYSALFLPSDTKDATELFDSSNLGQSPGDIILQDESMGIGTAIATRKLVKSNIIGTFSLVR